jgi:hypothetical protein
MKLIAKRSDRLIDGFYIRFRDGSGKKAVVMPLLRSSYSFAGHLSAMACFRQLCVFWHFGPSPMDCVPSAIAALILVLG